MEQTSKYLNFQEPVEENIEKTVDEHERVKSVHALLIIIIIVALNILSIILVTSYLGISYNYINL